MEALMLARANERLTALRHDEAPRSWSRDAKIAFLHLPPEIQTYYVGREKARDREVRNAQNDRAEALRRLAEAEARISELENLHVREAGDDPITAETGKSNGTAEIQDPTA
jgi:hypothetical protein